jgi:[acyl-carrier-protein] S-malonyltransferase
MDTYHAISTRSRYSVCVECGPGTVLSNLAKRLPNIEKAFAIDSKSRMEDALNAVLVAEGKIA